MRRLEEYIPAGRDRLRLGYTTGTCAAAAARAAAELLARGREVPAVRVETPAGIAVDVEVEESASGAGWASCAVRKDAGDDPDATDGALVRARVEWSDVPGVRIEGGEGVGRVTRPGLDQPVGAAAINSVPRRMIEEQIRESLEMGRPDGGGGVPCSNSPRYGQSATEHYRSCATPSEAKLVPVGENCAWHPAPSPRTASMPSESDSSKDSGELPEEAEGGGSVLKQPSLREMPTGHFSRRGTARGTSPLRLQAASPAQLDGTTAGNGEMAVEPSPNPSGAGDALAGEKGVLVTVSVPGGEELARRTFNPRLGIVGGISIIGTSGIVKPMSEEAMVRSLELEMRVRAAAGARDLLAVPGNYGLAFARDVLGLDVSRAVQCSNHFGDMLDAAARLGFRRVLVVGHLGKMAKVAGGIMNTHSRVADCRMEVLAAHAALAGAPQAAVRGVMEAATTDAALDVLAESGLVEATMASLVDALAGKLAQRAGAGLRACAIVFSKPRGELGATPGAHELAEAFRRG